MGAGDGGSAGSLSWRPGKDIMDMNRATEATRFTAASFSSRSDTPACVELHVVSGRSSAGARDLDLPRFRHLVTCVVIVGV